VSVSQVGLDFEHRYARRVEIIRVERSRGGYDRDRRRSDVARAWRRAKGVRGTKLVLEDVGWVDLTGESG
jgi:hypothetical protein